MTVPPALGAHRASVALTALLLGVSLTLSACGGSSRSSNPAGATITQVAGPSQTDDKYPGAIVVPPAAKPTVTLTDTADQPYDIAAETAGKVVLLYFGYTHCPDVCPINMALAAATLAKMPASERQRVTMVFVTTDPKRDTPKVIRSWLDNFNPSFVGLTGTIAQIHEAEEQVGMPLSVVENATKSASGGYQIEHAGYLLAYSQDNKAHLQFYDNESVPNFATSLDHLVEHGYQT